MNKPKIRIPSKSAIEETRKILETLELNSVCQSANCPNRWECFGKKTATFLIMGDTCTRNCRFCNVTSGTPIRLDPTEPSKVAEAVNKLQLRYVVITSVTRDDLADGGAVHFAETIRAVKRVNPEIKVEILPSDFDGNYSSIETVLDAIPTVFNHNIETVERLTPELRNRASYRRSLSVLEYAHSYAPNIPTKSGIMVGVGEHSAEVKQTLRDLRRVNCSIVTIGQYLAPTNDHYPVQEYISEEQFREYESYAKEIGFNGVASGPLVRSSYNAAEISID